MLWVSIASVVAIALICVRQFDIPLLLLLATLATAGVLACFRAQVRWVLPRVSLGLVVLASLALFLRSDLDPHLRGGQDQGLYTNMSAQMLRTKSLDYQDQFRTELSGKERALYDMAPMAAVELVDPDKSMYSIAFYPLHPAWMAVASWAFGKNQHTLSLLLFAALGIVGGYFLTLHLFGSRRAAALAAAFLSLNPALVFFSKFPVTEMVALAFTINGFLFFVKACYDTQPTRRWLHLLIAVLCFNGFFYTRMQFFMYIPFMGLLFAYALVAVRQPWSRRLVMMVFPAVLVLTFLLSLAFYHFFQPNLYDGIVDGHLDKLQKLAVLVAIGLGLVLLGLLAFLADRRRGMAVLERVDGAIQRWSGLVVWAVPLALLLSLPSIFTLYRTGSLAPFPWPLPVGQDPWLVRYHALYRLAQMLSPLGIALLLLLPVFRIQFSGAVKFGLLFLALVWGAVLAQPAIPYLYYYGRYVAGEMLPYSLLLTAGLIAYLWDGRWRWLGIAMAVFQCFFFLVFSAAQYNHVEGEDPEFFDRVARHVGPNDILLTAGLNDAQLVGLRVSYDLNVFSVTAPNGRPLPFDSTLWQRLDRLAKIRGGQLYLMVPQQSALLQEHLVERIPYRYGFMSNREHVLGGVLFNPESGSRLLLPLKFKNAVLDMSLYRVDTAILDRALINRCANELALSTGGAIIVDGLEGFSASEAHGRWTNGKRAAYSCRLPKGRKASMVEIQATAYVPSGRSQRVAVSVNGGEPMQFQFDSATATQRLQIPVADSTSPELTVSIDLPDAISPQQAEGVGDDRILGISINEIEIKE